MKIQKFGTIRFTDSGLPIFENFIFSSESEEEDKALRSSRAFYLHKVMETLTRHLLDAYIRNTAKLNELAERDMSYDQPVGNYSKSPVDIVNEFLNKAGKL